MSALVIYHTDEGATILTDTLVVTDYPELRPVRFASKVWVVPHLNLVLLGRGIFNFFEAWDRTVSELLCRDVVMLDEVAPELLRGVWSELLEQQPDAREDLSSTVYHLGFEDGTGRCVGYKYSSGADFESEQLATALRIMPAPEAEIDELPTPGATLDGVESVDMVAVVKQLHEEHRAKLSTDRCCIGGHLMLTVLTDGMIMTRRLEAFDDFEEQWLLMHEPSAPAFVPARLAQQRADALTNAGG